MREQQLINYQRISKAIHFIQHNFKSQPTLEELAEEVHLSPFHFQRLFTDWAGVSPKKFLQYISVEHAKQLLKNGSSTIFDAADDTGLSGTGRLHDLFINIEGMTPGEYKNGGQHLTINYSFADSPFGELLIAATPKGICFMAFVDTPKATLNSLYEYFPKAHFNQKLDLIQQNALYVFTHNRGKLHQIKLHLRGTRFQLKVWQSLLKIPLGELSTYGNIASQLNNPGASRAVGTALGSNPVAFLIPCHRVIKSHGIIGDYRWGSTRKSAIIGWEAAKQLKTS